MRRILLLILTIAPFYLLAQETNCGNGIDDDGDGFIDCFDSNCASSVSCKDFYVGRDKLCQVPPTGPALFEMKLGSKSDNRTNWSSSRIVAGDLDNDGIPEVVTLHHDDKKLYILDGRDLKTKYTGTITGTAEYFDHAIGNINSDNCAEIFIAEKDGGTFYISSYDCKGLLIWRKAIYGQPITMGLADFDEDGKVELYYRNEILDAATGTRLVKGSGTWTTIDAGPIAVDMLDASACTNCAGLELVLGGSIYSVNLGARTADVGVLTLEKSIPAAASYFPKNTSFGWVTSLTSVADYNQDGSLDVLMSGATGSTGGTTSVFFWDVKNNTYKIYQPSNNWQHGTGRVNIADIDGDGKSNATFVSGNRLFALKDDFTLLWSANINEGTSGYTSTTVFDFNNDKAVEIVYRDEAFLYIINGKTGAVFTQATCRSRTANDYPLVLDVDGDGSTEICVTCATNDTDNINDIARAPFGQVRSYKSNLQAWVPARKVWNQHGYFNVNVNDDLTIPRIQQKHHLVFSTGSCTTGANRALNTFLNQSPFLDSKGCPTYASADITYDAASVKIIPPTCPDQAFTVSLDIRNIGDLGLSGTLPITFYQGNPTQAGAVKLNTVTVNLSKFNVGDVVSLTNLSVQGTGANFTLYVVLNDNGTTVPTPIKLPNSTFLECNYTNNIVSAGVSPTPFSIQTALISNDIRCGTNTTPPNGAAEVYRLVAGNKVTVGYTFYWFNGATVGDTAVAVFKGPVRTGLAAGTYSIVAYNNGIKCGSTSAQVVVGQQTRALTAAITEDKPYTSCKNPDGKLTVTINGGDPFGNFTYQWFEGNVFGTSPILSTSHVITNVSAVTYSVLVTEKSTGCQILESAKVTDQTIKPIVSATTTEASCSPANSGSASANVSGNTNKYNFYWYVGSSVKPSPDFTGAIYTNITAGDYTVVANDKTGGCNSEPLVVTVASKLSVPVSTTVTAQQTSCTTTPNGAASALVSGGNTGFTFRWFRGNNTLVANLIGSASTITGLAAGVYTVEARNTSTGCVDTEIVTISDNIVIPVVNASVTSQQTQCSPVNGAVTASVTGAGSFTYYWFNGNIGTPDTLAANFKGASYTGRAAGFYTVVAANKSTRCLSARALVQVLDNTVNPTITTSTVNQTSCNVGTPNGGASANIGGVTAGYKFRWFTGSDTSSFLIQSASITNRAAGTYTVKAINTGTRCYSTQQVTITNNLVNPVVASTSIVNNINCSGVTPTGSVTIQVNGGADPITDFTIQWYEGTGTTTVLGTTVGSTAGTNKETAQALSAGTYTVRVTDNVVPGNGCSTTTTFTISNSLAVVTIDNADIALTPQSNCSPVNGSATVNEITVNGAGVGNTTGYTFTWLQSNGTTVIPGSGTAATIGVALAAGTYNVRAMNAATNCVSAVTPFTITDTHVNPAVTSALTVNNTNCTGTTANGSITINIGGVAPVAGQHNIEWFEGNGTTTALGTTVGSVTGAVNQTAQNLSAGTYTVRVTDLVTPNNGCATTTTFTITDAPAIVTIESADLALTSQSDCSPVNGSATVNEITVNGAGIGNTTGYTFTWLQSNGTTVIPGSGTAATIGVLLAAGNYNVRARNTATNCISAVRPFTITDTHINPVVTSASTVNNSNCTGTTANGSITINIGGVAPVAGQHNIEWFEGNGTTTALGAPGSVTGAANQTAQNLSAGTYTVRVTNLVTPNNGCATTTTFTITDAPAVVTIDNADLSLTSQSDCSPVNGSATVNEITVNGAGIGNTTGYTFTWLQSNGTTVIPGSGTAATIGVALAAGTYTVRATNTATNCVSAVTPFTITDTHVNPAVTSASTINNTNCTGATPNGSITINIGGVAPVAGQHNIEWFQGNGTTTVLGAPGSVTGAANQTAQNLSVGTYTVRVTDLVTPNNGCATTTTFTITDAPAIVTIESADLALTSQSDCSPVNGSATVNEITVNGAGIGNTTGYTFTWLQSNGATVIPGSGTAATIGVALAAGTYTVRATNTATNCVSAVRAFTITDTHVNPVVTSASTVNNTNCTGVTPNGSITINIGGIAPVAGQHNIEWFEGNGTSTILGTNVGSVTGAANQTAQDLSAGTYTVRVTDLVTPNNGCATTTTFTITDAPAIITIESADLALTSQSDCSPVNGSATVNEITVNGAGIGNTTGYTFTWLQSNGTTVIPGSGTAATIGVLLAAGNYNVRARNTATNCISAVAPFTITDTHVNPVVTSASTVNNTNCTGTTANGSITINIGGVAPVAGQHNIEWFQGNGTTTALGAPGIVTGAANQTAQNLSAGTYTVRVTDLVTPNNGCATTTTFTITDAPAIVTIESADLALTSQSDCSPVNGSATVNEITVNGAGIGNTTGYTFTWLQSNGTTVIPGSGTAATIGVALAAGTYTVRATNTATNCVSAVRPFTITDTHINPVVTSASTVNNTNCTGATPNGSITINIGGIAPVAGQHNIEWFEGNGTTTALGAPGSVTGAANQTAQNLSAGTYTVRVTDLVTPNNGCATITTFIITDAPAVVTIESADLSLTSQSDCSPVNGSATVSEITVNGAGIGNTTGYTFTWLQSNGTTVIPGSGTAATIGIALAAGTYTVRATNTATNCVSAVAPFTITDTHVNPVVTSASTVNNTNCTGVTPNGSITINIGGIAPVAGQHNIEWFEGNGTSTILGTNVGSVTGAANQTAQDLSAGTYTVRVTDLVTPNNGCATTTTFTITDAPAIITIESADLALTSQSDCSPVNGSATVNEITVNGAGIGNTTGYTFTWLQSNGTTVIPGSGTAATIGVALAAGNYTVRARNTATNCVSAVTPFTITDTHVNPAVTSASTVNNTNCTGAIPNGSITINIGGIAPVAGQHNIEWFEGNGTTTALGAPGSVTGAANQTAQNLSAGTYTVRVTDLVTPNNGCATTTTFTITDAPAVVTIDNADLSLTSQSNCSPANGLATVNEITVNGAGIGNTTGYTFTWLQSNGTTVIPGSGTAATIGVALAAGTYTVRATNTLTNCVSAIVAFTITDTHVNPVTTLVSSVDNTNCTGVTPNGSITIEINGGDPVTDFTIDWFEGNGTTIPLGTTVGITAGLNNETADEITGGTYTVRVRDNASPDAGCFFTTTFTILDNLTLPIPEGTPFANTACDPAKSNGSIVAGVGGIPAAAGYTFHIFRGQNTLPANEVPIVTLTATASNLTAGTYTVQAINDLTGCSNTTEVIVDNNIVLPTIASITSDVTSCSPFNGSMSVNSVSIGVIGDYTFSWFNGNSTSSTSPFPGITGPLLAGMSAGTYTVTGVNNTLGCAVQTPVTDVIIDDPSLRITINNLVPERIIPAICTAATGQLGVEASSPANLSGFAFSWYTGDKNVGMTFINNGVDFSPPSYGNRIPGIKSGLHTVIAVDNTTGCQDSLSINLPYSDEAAIVNLLPSPQTVCDVPDGVIRTTVNPSGGTVAAVAPLIIDQSWYEIRVYQNGTQLTPVVPGNPAPALFTEVTGLKAGSYTVIAYEVHPSLSGCASQPNDTTVLDNTVHPVVIPDVLSDNKNCIGPGTGSISLNVDGVATPPSGFTYIWHDGQFTTDLVLPGANVPAPGHTAIDLDGGFYTIEVTNTIDGCSSDTTFNINNDPYVISVASADLNIIDQTDCSPADGSATVLDVLLDGASSGGTAGYTFEWFLSDGTTAIPSSSTTDNVGTPIAAGTYFVQATSTVSNCTSPLVQFVVDDVSVTPVITQNTLIDNSNCAGAASNGSITIDVDGGAPAPANYTIQWYTGIGTTTPIALATTATLSNLAAGDYTVEVTDILSPGNTCSSIATFTIVDDLPVFTIAAASITVTDQTDCVANGTAEVTDVLVDGVSNGGVAGFTFEWFDGNGVSIDGPGATAVVSVALGAGNYTVIATNTTSLCSSTVATFTVDDVSVTPVITQNTLIDNTNCAGAASNGSITIDVDGGAPAPANYTIQWYTGIGTTTPIALATTATLSNLAAGDYTVEVTDILSPGNTCSSIATFTIVDDLPVFTIAAASITVTDQTDCVANGTAEVTDVLVGGVSNGGVAGFTFEWFDGNGVSIDGPGATAVVSVALAVGNYTVIATNTTSLCSSTVATFTVDDVSITPVITQNTLIDNSNCAGAASNGSITIDVDGGAPAPANYTIQWYTGIGTATPIALATTATLSNLAAGDYTVEVTDILSPGNTCSSIATFTIVDDLPVFTIAAASITVTDQTDCVANGTAEVTDVLVDGVSNGGVAGFTFEWFDGNGVSIDGPGATSVVSIALGAGNYTVIATNTTSLCSSTVSTFTVDDVSVTPVITQNTLIDNSNCAGAASNGSITIDVDGGAPAPANYTIQWYTGIGTTTPIALATTATLSNLAAGDYTVEVTDILSPGNTCSSIATFTIVDDLPVFTIAAASITVTDQTDCVANGSAEVTDVLVDGVSNGGVGGFTFEWFDGNGVSIDGPGATAVVSVALGAGNYTVIATNTTSLCSSTVATFTVDDVSVTPVITQNTLIDNSNCAGAASNGSITIDVDGGAPAPANYTIQWYTGIGTTTPIALATTATLSNLAAGDYTVEVTDILSPGNTCSSIATFTIVDDLPVFTIAAASITVTDQTDCVANGTAEVTDVLIDGVSNGGVAGFTFEWFDGNGVSIDGPGATAVVSVALGAGNYTVIATNTTSLCSSTVATFTVDDVSVTPVITQNTLIDNSNCAGAASNGSITIDVDGGAPAPANYTIQWYTGIGTTTPIALATTATLSNLAAGDYTVEVTDILSPGNTCSSIATFTVVDDLPVFTIAAASITVTDQTDCMANGSAEVTDVLVDGVSNGGVAGFTFEWFDGNGVSIDGPGATAVVSVALAAGNYTVIATNTTSLCSSTVATFTVDDVSVTPVITQNTLIDNSNCAGAASNGSITIDVDGGAPAPANYTIQWYTGIGTTTPIALATTATLSNLAAGDYTVEVTDILSPGNTCSSIATFTIVDDLPVFTIAAASITVTDQTDCVANGSAEVTDVLVDGVSNGGVAGFTFEWFDGNGVSIDGPGATAVVSVALGAGNYTVIATNTTSLCSSTVATFTVDDVSVTPVITQNTLIDNTNCAGAASNGSITIDVDGGAPAPANYTIQWYTGIGTTTPIALATTATLSNLAAGDYTVEVTDILSPGNTCSSIATFTIVDDLPVFTIAAASITVTDQTDCVANGTAEVTDVLVGGVSNGGVAGFTFEWFDGNGVSIDGPGATAVVSVALGAGNYTVIATNTTSLCSSTVATFTVDDVSVTPVITQNTLIDNSNCAGAASNGSITIDVDGGAPAPANYTIQWYTGIGTTTPIALATTATLSNLAAGDYTVEVTDILSPGNTCSSIATFTVVDDLPVFTIAAASITVTDQTDCVANGTAEVTDVLVDGVSNGGVAGFTFEWFDGNGVSIDGPGATSVVSIALGAGNYTVIATNTTSLCSSTVSTFTVDDVSVTPVITQNTLIDNSNCAGAASNGSITIDVDGGAPAPANYTIQWYTGIGTTTPIALATTATLSNLAAGDYTVEVTDILSPGNTCSSITTFTILDKQNNIAIDLSDLVITDNSDCLPINGSASVTDIFFNGVAVGNTTGYTFEWLRNDLTPVDPGNGPTVGVNLTPDTYFVRATHVASNCSSPLIPFEIKDVTVIPTLVAVVDLDNIACNTNYTGQVSATVSEGFTNGITAGYLFEWFAGSNNTNPADFINSGSILPGLQEGDYTVRVTDTSAPSVNCSNIATVTIEREIPVLNGILTANAQTTCAPIQNGNMTVNNIQQFLGSAETSFDMNVVADRNQFSFQWFDETLANVSPVVNGNNISPNLSEGTFYVQISDVLGCTSDYIIGLIDDQTSKPQIRLDEFVNPAICILPEVRGTLLVSADNNPNFGDYTFEWFQGNNTSGTLVEPNSPFIGNIAYTDQLEYTVQVRNNATQCFSLETYKFKTDTVAIQVVASAVPLTSCVTDNGSLFAATRTGSGQLYNIEWYIGAGVDATPDFTGNEVLIAPIGTYTAIARHPSLNFCNSIADTIDVTDGRFYPTVMATQKAPLTYCDPSNPNGVAFATVNGGVVGYNFDWYEGSLSGNSIYTGSEAGILKATTYIVQATDVISGCAGTTSIVIGFDPLATPIPQITVISNRTDCGTQDGALSADVNGSTQEYIFNWYDGSAVKNQPDALGEIYSDIDAGVYTVTATDRITGCMSDGVQKEVLAAMVYPDFIVKTINNICDDNVGSAKVDVTGEVEVKTVEWDIQGAIEVGPQISDLPSGIFTVTAISFKNCETSKTFEIKTDIAIYNAVSKNNDGLNDIFEVGCISEYPNNSVRIFNRAGTLVYEASGYDNQDIYFNGISNRGVNILGNDLPDGTYFYIINKGDGSEPKTGYLELLH